MFFEFIKGLQPEKLEKAGTVYFRKTRAEGVVPQILEFKASRDSGKSFQQFFRDFPGIFLGNAQADPSNSHSLLEFSDTVEVFRGIRM